MARRANLTNAGLLAESYGERPYTVTLREEKEPGTNVILDYSVLGKRKKSALGYPVRRKVAGRWTWDGMALDRAREAAQDRSAGLRLTRMREDVLTPALTFSAAVALYTDPERGGMPRDKRSQMNYRAALRIWTQHFGASTPWNAIKRSDVVAWVRKREARGQIPSALHDVSILRVLYRWLDQQAGIDGLLDPTKGFQAKKLRDAHTVKRPRYTEDELRAMLRVRHDVDPRFALYIALMDDSGVRSKALRTLMRSAIDQPLETPPSEDEAPFGWIVYPALKGQRSPLHFLTAFERREIEFAFAGYLQEMEQRFQWTGIDYPVFPGARIADKRERVVGVVQPGSMRAASEKRVRNWLRAAEKAADVEWIEGRGFHGVRRLVSDLLYAELGLDATTTAMGWSTTKTPEQIYIDHRRMGDRAKAREAMERRRKGPDDVSEA